MYRFEGEKIAKGRGQGIKIEIDKRTLLLIIEYSKKYDSAQKAMTYLKGNNLIDPTIADSTYKRKMYRLQEYKDMMKSRDNMIKDKYDKVVALRSKNYSYKKISTITGLSYDTVYGICKKTSTLCEPKKRNLTTSSAKEEVKLWSDNYFHGRIPTSDTIEAFKLLGLEPPKNK